MKDRYGVALVWSNHMVCLGTQKRAPRIRARPKVATSLRCLCSFAERVPPNLSIIPVGHATALPDAALEGNIGTQRLRSLRPKSRLPKFANLVSHFFHFFPPLSHFCKERPRSLTESHLLHCLSFLTFSLPSFLSFFLPTCGPACQH
jgi:hypothetical protein